ncbi:hypothetical protein [Candidatus Cardinium sp. cByotN1]|uniref:hypothetical protein n=1 Tax=Candidatus Cardinium sp. cByotN1 TaxID=2699439 RepID=UPI001FB22A86|nr:hypothetical protein [Candidatus Cardinium sp. cByotN1]
MEISSISSFLRTISITIFLAGFNHSPSKKAILKASSYETVNEDLSSRKSHKGVWSIPTGLGVHWKPKADAERTNNRWVGFFATTGIKWEKLLYKRYTFSAGLLWGLFLPDMFMVKKEIPFHINLGIINITIPFKVALFLPMTSLQLGYFFNSKWHFSCGLIYCYALECNINYLLFSKIAINGKLCLFLDKFIKNHGIHLGFASIGIDYKLFR